MSGIGAMKATPNLTILLCRKRRSLGMEEGKSDLQKESFLPFLKFLKGKEVYLALAGGELALVCHIAVMRLIETFDIKIKEVVNKKITR
jgi:hypothetical protein